MRVAHFNYVISLIMACRRDYLRLTLLSAAGCLCIALVIELQAAEPASEPNYGQSRSATGQKTSASSVEARRLKFVRTVDFYLSEGGLVSGLLVSEGDNQVVVRRLEGSRLVADSYSKREIDSRTYDRSNVFEYKYYIDLAEKFAARTWDFDNDPDDFIQAIRCYEKAKQALKGSDREGDEVGRINRKITTLEKDRQVWKIQMESRAELRKLEFVAEAQKKLDRLRSELAEVTAELEKNKKRLEELAAMEQDYKDLSETVSKFRQDFRREIDIVQTRLQDNRRLTDSIYRRRYYNRPYYRYRYSPRTENQNR